MLGHLVHIAGIEERYEDAQQGGWFRRLIRALFSRR